MDWWSFLIRNGHGNKSLHIEYQTCTSNLRWCTSKCLALCNPQIMLKMLRIYILLISIWCRLSLYVLCSDMPSLFALYISGYGLVHDGLSDPGSSYNGRHKRHWPSCNEDYSHIDWAIVWWWSMPSIHTRWYAIRDCSCLFLERIPGCWGWSAK